MREIVLDIETTGLQYKDGDRIIDIACMELSNLIPTGRTYQTYVNPEGRKVGKSVEIHNLTDEFLQDKKLFKKVLSKFSTGITVVGINVKGINIAKTINSFTTLSISPPLVLFSLDINASYLNKFKKSKFLSINILGKNQTDISNIFAKKDPKWKKEDSIIFRIDD